MISMPTPGGLLDISRVIRYRLRKLQGTIHPASNSTAGDDRVLNCGCQSRVRKSILWAGDREISPSNAAYFKSESTG